MDTESPWNPQKKTNEDSSGTYQKIITKKTQKKTSNNPFACKSAQPPSRIWLPLFPNPSPFAHRVLHYLLARIAEAIRVLSGIRRAGAKLQLHGVLGLVLLSPSPVHIHVQCTFSV